MPFPHPSGLPYSSDRIGDRQDVQSLVFHGKRPFLARADLQDMQSVIRNRHDRLGRLIARDGDRIERAIATVDIDAGTVALTDGRIYVAGDVFPVAAATLEDVAMEGRVEIGVRRTIQWVTADDDPDLVGQAAGSLAEGEPGAAREVATIAWALAGDGGDGDFYRVYTLLDGTLLDETLPPALDGVRQQIAIDQRHWGNYIVSGCRVTALGLDGDGAQVFAIEQGEARVNGFSLRRTAALRHAEPEDWDTQAVPGETHTYPGGASYTFPVDQAPIDEIASILLTKEKTVTLVRGGIEHGIDALPDTSVIELIAVAQDETEYVIGTDCKRTGNGVDWDGPGAEPLGGSSYNVTYRYRASVAADAFTATTITVSGGAEDGDIIVAYTAKLPRVDRLCLAQDGSPVYVKGVSAARNAMMPIVPADLLALATVTNDWMAPPRVSNDGVQNLTIGDIQEWFRVVDDLRRLVMVERGRHAIDARDPAAYRNMFVDPLIDDALRDAGEPQTAAVAGGMIQLDIEPTFYYADLDGPVTLDFTEEVIASQELVTKCVRINPFRNFTPLPGRLTLTPATDFWAATTTEWASPQTIEHNRGVRVDSGPLETVSVSDELVGRREQQAEFLRQIEVAYRIEGFGNGENLEVMTFDGLDITPDDPPAADEDGVIEGTFNVPASQTAGTKVVRAAGQGGTRCQALYAGGGTITVTTMRRVTTIDRWTAPPVVSPAAPASPPAAQTNHEWAASGGGHVGSGSVGGSDPQAQVFVPPELRQLVGVDFRLCAIGDTANAILVHQVGVDGNTIEMDPVAEAFVPMAGAVTGWKSARYGLPCTTPADRQHAFVVKTDDANHAISAAALGEFDAAAQQWVTAHPYPIGPRAEGVNAAQWSFVQAEALTFRLVAAKYAPAAKTVELGSFDLIEASDLQVRAVVDLPSPDCSVVFEIERADHSVIRLLPYQVVQLAEYVTETVALRAVLTGTQKLSPILYAPVMLVAGSIAAAGTYVSRAFDAGVAVDLVAYLKAFLPPGGSVTFSWDAADDDWHELAADSTDALAVQNWVEKKFSAADITAAQIRIKVAIAGGPAARVVAGDLGAGLKG